MWATSTPSRRGRACTTLSGSRRIALSAQVASWCPRMTRSWMSARLFMGRSRNGAFGAVVGGCKRRIFVGNTQSTSERRYPSLTVCGRETRTGTELEGGISGFQVVTCMRSGKKKFLKKKKKKKRFRPTAASCSGSVSEPTYPAFLIHVSGAVYTVST